MLQDGGHTDNPTSSHLLVQSEAYYNTILICYKMPMSVSVVKKLMDARNPSTES